MVKKINTRISYQKTAFIWCLFTLFIIQTTNGQLKKVVSKKIVKWGYIESDKILNQMSEYHEMKQEADTLLYIYKQTFKMKKDSLHEAKASYERTRLSLPLEKREKIEEGLETSTKALDTYKSQIFALDGEYFKKRNALLEVPLSKLFQAADDVANDLNINIFFDKSSDNEHIIYINKDHDYSDYVLEKLGLGDNVDIVH